MITGWEIDPYGSHGIHLTGCLEAAGLAPSVHNSQPWRLRVAPGRIDVLLDPERLLPVRDPGGREAWISVGAAILNLRVAILAAGRMSRSRLMPDPDNRYLAASVSFGEPYRPDGAVRALSGAIARRHTNRQPFRGIEVRDEVLDQLSVAARTEGGTMAVASPADREAILELGPAGQTAPTVVVLSTAGDCTLDWLRAGQAMERVLLTATVRGVANTPMVAPARQPSPGRVAQIILRLGYGDPVPATPRRPIREVVDT